jgi:diadenylate cyclase
MVERIANEIEKYVAELGSEGRLVNMQLEELMVDIKDQGLLVVKDYLASGKEETGEEVWELLGQWSAEDLLDLSLIARALGHSGGVTNLDTPVTPRGYRILTKIPRLPMPVIENLTNTFQRFPDVLAATTEELDDVEGIGEVRAKAIQDGLRRLREQVLLDRHI